MRQLQPNLFRLCTAARKRLGRQEGQALIEYALILGLVATLTIGVLQAMGANVSGLLNQMSSHMSSVSNP